MSAEISDYEDFSDDEDMIEIRKQKEKEFLKNVEAYNKEKEDILNQVIICWNPSIEQYRNANKYSHNPLYSDIITEYIRKGTDINAKLRGAIPIDDLTKDFVKKFDNLFTKFPRLDKMFPQNDDIHGNMIKVYRTSSKDYDSNLTQGYTSTANKPVGMSNIFLFTIFIPKDAVVIVWDISSGVGQSNTYEVILPRDTTLIEVVDMPKNKRTFIVKTEFSSNNIDKLAYLAHHC